MIVDPGVPEGIRQAAVPEPGSAAPAVAERDGEMDFFGTITDIILSSRMDIITGNRTVGQCSACLVNRI